MLDPVTLVLVPGVLGGAVIALLIFRLQRRVRDSSPDASRDRYLSTDVINMAHIRVAGVGGLGLIATAGWVAFNVPRIGQAVAIGIAAGAAFAVVLIHRRRSRGPLPSSGARSGANTVLSIDEPAGPRGTGRRSGNGTRRSAIVTSAHA